MDAVRLIDPCRRGDRQAQEAFYRLLAPMVFGVCRRYLPDVADAEDALIQAMHKALTGLDTLKDERTLLGWIRRIAVNECLMILRKRRLDLQPETELTLPDSGPDAQHRLQAEEVLALLDRLPPGYRTVFNLYVLEGYTHREIGDLLGISLNTSKSQLIQARKRLAEWIITEEKPERHVS